MADEPLRLAVNNPPKPPAISIDADHVVAVWELPTTRGHIALDDEHRAALSRNLKPHFGPRDPNRLPK